jgi:hypothetical protein
MRGISRTCRAAAVVICAIQPRRRARFVTSAPFWRWGDDELFQRAASARAIAIAVSTRVMVRITPGRRVIRAA